MRRQLLLTLSFVALAATPSLKAYAQGGGGGGSDAQKQQQADDDAKKKKKDKEWNLTQAPLPEVKNAGPCPYVKTLYDASRYIELKNDAETPSAVGFTGEIQDVRATCAYKGADPIVVNMALDFAFGRGPQAEGYKKTYRYWVAVTVRNDTVLDKQYFDVPAMFEKGQDRIAYIDRIQNIVIPRANKGVSGSNFEVLVGFDVTPKMAEFNRLGKRFRVNSGVDLAENTKTGSAAAK
ncbi:MAG: Tat pathway signal sequence domain protein [Caulobacteraceae bacterium]